MSELNISIIVIVVLGLLYILPLAIFIKLNELIKNFRFKSFVVVVNSAIIVYVVIALLMLLSVASMGEPLIEDPEYPDPSEEMFGGIVIGFMVITGCFFIPLMLIVNLIGLILKKRKKNYNKFIKP